MLQRAIKHVIVESPTKAKAITKILGADWSVRAKIGHMRVLPHAEARTETSVVGDIIVIGHRSRPRGGIHVAEPEYEVLRDKRMWLQACTRQQNTQRKSGWLLTLITEERTSFATCVNAWARQDRSACSLLQNYPRGYTLGVSNTTGHQRRSGRCISGTLSFRSSVRFQTDTRTCW